MEEAGEAGEAGEVAVLLLVEVAAEAEAVLLPPRPPGSPPTRRRPLPRVARGASQSLAAEP